MVRAVLMVVSRILWRLSFEGLENVPREGSFVLAPVHRSFIDFGLVSGVTRRQLRYMGKDSLWRNPLLGRFISTLGAYPVSRGSADRESMRVTEAIVAAGEPVVMFPEGTRRSGPVVAELLEGPAFVAARAGVPIVPVGIGGSELAMPKGSKVPRRVKIHVIVGAPIIPPALAEGRRHPSRRTYHELSVNLQRELQRLFDEAQVVSRPGLKGRRWRPGRDRRRRATTGGGEPRD